MTTGRACTRDSAVQAAVRRCVQQKYVRADVFNDYGTHLYTVVRTNEGGLNVVRQRGEKL